MGSLARLSQALAPMLRPALLALLCFSFAACGGGSDLGPPSGWVGEGTERWWRADADTVGVFRDLDTLESMGAQLFEDVDLGTSVQNRMIELYRTNPEIVDSLFAERALPIVQQGAPEAGDRTAQRERIVSNATRELARYYRQPLVKPESVPPKVMPDSLVAQGVGGQVILQVYVDADGQPLAIETIEGAHPTLDALAMQAAAQVEWTDPWVVAGRESYNVPAWTRFKITY